MGLREYMDRKSGRGVLATADSSGNVDAAVYAKPYFLDDGNVAFVMADSLSRRNVNANPNAVFLFMEEGSQHEGKRLFLKKVGEEDDPEKIDRVFDKVFPQGKDKYKDLKKHLVYFSIDKEMPLVSE